AATPSSSQAKGSGAWGTDRIHAEHATTTARSPADWRPNVRAASRALARRRVVSNDAMYRGAFPPCRPPNPRIGRVGPPRCGYANADEPVPHVADPHARPRRPGVG